MKKPILVLTASAFWFSGIVGSAVIMDKAAQIPEVIRLDTSGKVYKCWEESRPEGTETVCGNPTEVDREIFIKYDN